MVSPKIRSATRFGADYTKKESSLSMEAKRLQAYKLVSEVKQVVAAMSVPIDAFIVTSEDATTLSQAAKALAVMYKLHLFIHQPDKSSYTSDLIASIDEEISRINKKHNELLLDVTPAVDDEEQHQQDAVESKKRLHELLGVDSREDNDHDQDDDMMEQLLKKKKKKNKKNKK